MNIVVDTRHWPLVYIAYPRAFSDADWDELLVQAGGLLDRKQSFAWINDARTPYIPNARQRTALANHQKARADDYRRWARGAAVVSQSAVVRGVITAMSWVFPTPFPHETFASLAEAERWIRRQLGLPAHQLTIADERERLSA
ncbi:MAG: hypothetical protein ABW321_09530 [Polyangiales bacterium]